MANDIPPVKPTAEIVKAECPDCGDTRNAWVRGEHVTRWSDKEEGTYGSVVARILECCGCDSMFFRRETFFSEWETIGEHPVTGQMRLEGGTKTEYWPPLVKRRAPGWVDDLELSDRALGTILSETYTALNNDLRILAAIGARTAFDHSSESLASMPACPSIKSSTNCSSSARSAATSARRSKFWSRQAVQRRIADGGQSPLKLTP
jgi:hypothetical protein